MEELVYLNQGDQRPLFKEGVVVLVDKPMDWTSFDVVSTIRNRVSRIEQVKRIKVGHAGTLDPLATGLLIVCVGKYTKKIDSFQAQKKRYTGVITVGGVRPSYDMETEIEQEFPTEHITDEMVEEVVQSLQGEIDQKPPIYSAIKIDGERLYKKARRGQDVEIKTRKVTLHEFKITKREGNDFHFVLDCSKGTYVRSLAFDFGKALNSGGYLKSLRREKIGDFDIKNAWELDELKLQLDKWKEIVLNNVS